MTNVDKIFYNEIKSALNEKDVENTYRRLFQLTLPHSQIKSYSSTDGVLISPYIEDPHKNLVALLEFKHNRDFQNSEDDITSVLMQSLYYLKKLEKENTFPKVIFGADQNAGFCISTDKLQKYLHDENIDWSFAPSSAYTNNPELANKLKNDTEIIPHHFAINENFKFSDIILKMFNLDEGNIIKIPVTNNNIDVVFKEFNENVLKEKNLTTHQEVSIFMNILLDTDKEHNYIREDKSILITSVDGIDKVKINDKRYKSFFTHYQTEYTLKEQNELAKTCDRLIEDESRRREGAFFTPTIWVNEAHKQITSQLGPNWKNDYVVWDCCSGTGNLTRDYQFANLYSSTLLQEELDIARGNNVNPEATHFKHDFTDKSKESLEALRGETSGSRNVNGYFDTGITEEKSKLPPGLQTALEENKPIMFFMNPPFGTANSAEDNKKGTKVGIANSTIKEIMKLNGISSSSNQLFAQFLYRILLYKQQYNLSNIVIATFATPKFLQGESFKKFRQEFLNNFNYKSGMSFQSNHFPSVSGTWPISFTVWKTGITKNKKEFTMDLKDINENGNIHSFDTKTIYNMDNDARAIFWAKDSTKGIKKNKNVIQVKSALNPNGKCAKVVDGSIGYFETGANSVRSNEAASGLYSTICSFPDGVSVLPTNYKTCVSLFAAKKTIPRNWINYDDEYYTPNTTHPNYEQWNNDAIVYSLFNSKSQQSSLRDIRHENKSHNIKNEFFWLSKDHMLKLGEKNHYDDLQHDVANDHERFIYTQLQNITLSPDAQAVLDKATELVDKSFEHRKKLNETDFMIKGEALSYNLQCWDAGWYQIKLILKEFLPEDLKEFNKLYTAFETRMREGVYEFGFLKR